MPSRGLWRCSHPLCLWSVASCPLHRHSLAVDVHKSNEAFSYASMLVASHDNAVEWSLFMGDRGIIDTLFNKPMFIVPEHRAVHWVAPWFRLSCVLQTFVAAQKGWDGVFLVALVGVQWVFHSVLRGPSLVRGWLECEGIDGKVET
ncbi:hypothetical protein J3458_018968 [Metarhizium acridum]|uniref:uncharacterized protein n=1 Tax=Metarhizium acridum TaxID=92637 RepID=UPI001C6CE820|nr:hypothetical protein J3458_018968 [Metarhizium acridum]